MDGPHRAAVLLQTALGVTADGRIGPITRQAIANCSPGDTIVKLTMASEAFYRGLNQPRFTRGWINRARAVNHNALIMFHQGTNK